MHIAYRGPNSGTWTGWGGAQSATTRKVLPHFPVGPGARESWTPDSWERAQRLNKLKAERLVEPEARAERVPHARTPRLAGGRRRSPWAALLRARPRLGLA